MLKAELQDAYDDALRTIEKMKRDAEEFKNDVIMAASQAAFEHDLCKVLDETLAKCGIKVPTVEVIVESATIYRLPLTIASRVGFLDEGSDLKQVTQEQIGWGVLNNEFNEEDEDFGVPGGVDTAPPMITNVTIKQLPTAA